MNQVKIETVPPLNRTHKASIDLELDDKALAELTAVIGKTTSIVFTNLYKELTSRCSQCNLIAELADARIRLEGN